MAEVFVKLESFNPGGSVKDRIALNMIEDAQSKGLIKPGITTIVEPTSGNTGIGLAMVCAVKGFKLILTMPETMSLERLYILNNFGAEIILTPGIDGMTGSVKKAEEIVAANKNCFMPHQFNNQSNPDAHRKNTVKEILEAVGKFDVFVATVGTGGTITGVGEILKQEIPSILIIAVEPKNSAVLSGGQPGPHRIQGIGAGFIPEVLNKNIIDEIIPVSDEDAYHTAKELAKKEGIFMGISSGAALWAALRTAEKLGQEKKVVTILPDTGERYFTMEQYFED
jgi:cysteine synthase A